VYVSHIRRERERQREREQEEWVGDLGKIIFIYLIFLSFFFSLSPLLILLKIYSVLFVGGDYTMNENDVHALIRSTEEKWDIKFRKEILDSEDKIREQLKSVFHKEYKEKIGNMFRSCNMKIEAMKKILESHKVQFTKETIENTRRQFEEQFALQKKRAENEVSVARKKMNGLKEYAKNLQKRTVEDFTKRITFLEQELEKERMKSASFRQRALKRKSENHTRNKGRKKKKKVS